MQSPDFACVSAQSFDRRDLLFLFEHFPVAGVDVVEAVRRVHEQPNTLESLLESRYVYDALMDRSSLWLEVSPRLFFDVMLRHTLPGPRDPLERRVIHYLANLLGLFTQGERLYRPQNGDSQRYEYLADLVIAAADADESRRFIVNAHIGNYALFLSGVRAEWIEHRRRYHHRPLSIDYYRKMGRSYYASAAGHTLASDFGLREVFRRLAERFEHFRAGLQQLAANHLTPAGFGSAQPALPVG